MAKVRVYELAKELGIANKELIAVLTDLGIEVKSHSSSITEDEATRARSRLGAGEAPAPAVSDAEAQATPAEKAAAPTAKPVGEKSDAKVRPETAPPSKSESSARREGTERPKAAKPTQPEPEPVTIEREPEPEPEPAEDAAAAGVDEEPASAGIQVLRGASVQDFAAAIGSKPAAVVKALMELGEMKSATESMTDDEVELVAEALGVEVTVVSPDAAAAEEAAEDEAAGAEAADAEPRPPVVTVMGHVDHGKTSILDAIRHSSVAAREAGGITQHIGAYQVDHDGRVVTFIDTPGHAAFTEMRRRGANVTDLVVLVVAADDGVMPQTVEALNHAKAAGVPIVVAVNKIDKENADPARSRQQLSEHELIPVEWGGDTEFVDVSAKTGDHIDDLLETIGLVAELEDLRASPTVPALGIVVEAHLDKGRGPVATVIDKQGTLRPGAIVVCGAAYGKVRAMLDDAGKNLAEARPSTPAQILGLQSVPSPGDEFRVVPDERTARQVAQKRHEEVRRAEQVATPAGLTLESLFTQVQSGEITELPIVLKADVQGSLEAVADALQKLSGDEVKVKLIHRGVGGVNENDVRLAEASGGLVLGFNVRPDNNARRLAEKEGVDVRGYRVIYEMVEDVENALKGMLAPEFEEIVLGQAEVRATFRVPRAGTVAGCYVTDGQITRNSKVRLLREGVVVYDGTLSSLKRFKDDVREVNQGYECGMGLDNFQDVKEGDVIEAYEMREIPR